METLYFSTPFQIFDDVFVGQTGFIYPVLECGKVFGIFGKTEFHRLVNKV